MALGTVVVFGGSSGIGLGVAAEVIKAGGRVVISSTSKQKADSVVARLNTLASETRAFGCVADLSDAQSLEENVISVLKYASSSEVTGNESGRINHIVHTAGDAYPQTTLKDWSPVGAFSGWTVRYLTSLTIGKHAPTYLAETHKSSITYTTGTHCEKPSAGISTFIAAAAAVESTARALAIELAPIRVNIVSPGAIDTPMVAAFNEHSPAIVEHFKQDNLMKRLGTQEESAQPYLYFMRDSFQTGTTLRSDGGRMLKG